MEYGKPTKLPDGRYFLKITGAVPKQINSAEVQEANCFKVSASLDEYDSEILKQAVISSEEWFGRKIDNLKSAFDSSISSGILEAPLTKKTKVFDSQKNEVDPRVLVPGVRCDIIVELTGIWFVKKSFGPVWRVIQARLKKETSVPQKYMFSDEADSDDE
jgi:hypothetical protein